MIDLIDTISIIIEMNQELRFPLSFFLKHPKNFLLKKRKSHGLSTLLFDLSKTASERRRYNTYYIKQPVDNLFQLNKQVGAAPLQYILSA